MNQEEITAYVLLAKNGDSASFCKLYELYYKDMYRFAYYKFKSWIFQILSTKCKRQIAIYVSNREHLKEDAESDSLIQEDHPYAEHMDVRKAFSKLNEKEKMIVSLMVFAGYNSRETAKILNSQEGNKRPVKSRALTKMSQYLKEEFA